MLKRYISIPITIVTLIFFSCIIVSAENHSDDEIEEIQESVEKFYKAVINQNHGVMQNIYSIPYSSTGIQTSDGKQFYDSVEYLDYIYPTNEYLLNDFEILSLEKYENSSFYHASIQLKGTSLLKAEENMIAFTQDILVFPDENNVWKVSLERFVVNQLFIVEDKSFDELTDKEKIYRFFLELSNNNYGSAAELMADDMEVLQDYTAVQFLKSYQKELQKAQLTIYNLFIQNAFGVGDKTVYHLSSTPSPTKNTFSDFIGISRDKGVLYLKENYDKPTEQSEGSLFSTLKNPLTVFIVSVVVACIIWAALNFYYRRIERTQRNAELDLLRGIRGREERVIESSDIGTSVDTLLSEVEEEPPSTNIPGATTKPNKERVLNLESKESDDVSIKPQGLPAGRKVYIDD